jgi:hypothetical protein
MLYMWTCNVRQAYALQTCAWPNKPPLAPVFAISAPASCWVSHRILWPSPPESAPGDQYLWTQRVPSSRSGYEGYREASFVGATRDEKKRATVGEALRELTLYARLFLAHTRRIWRQAQEFSVECLRGLPVPKKEVRFLHGDGGDCGGDGGQKENESMETHCVTNYRECKKRDK